jgi:hypothetical protein
VRKIDEVEALFCAITVSHILDEEIFKNEVLEHANKYNFDNMKHLEDEPLTFRELSNK